jgi:hypothetical protein
MQTRCPANGCSHRTDNSDGPFPRAAPAPTLCYGPHTSALQPLRLECHHAVLATDSATGQNACARECMSQAACPACRGTRGVQGQLMQRAVQLVQL